MLANICNRIGYTPIRSEDNVVTLHAINLQAMEHDPKEFRSIMDFTPIAPDPDMQPRLNVTQTLAKPALCSVIGGVAGLGVGGKICDAMMGPPSPHATEHNILTSVGVICGACLLMHALHKVKVAPNLLARTASNLTWPAVTAGVTYLLLAHGLA